MLTSIRTVCLAICLALASPAFSASLAIICEERDAGKPATMTIAYEGEAEGTLFSSKSLAFMSMSEYRHSRGRCHTLTCPSFEPAANVNVRLVGG